MRNLNHYTTISQETTIYRNSTWLFDFTQDFSERKKWDKQTKEIAFYDGHTRLKKGAKVYTKSVEGIRMETEYLTFEAPYEISIRMLNRSSIFKSFIGTWEYLQKGSDKTILKITYQFHLRFPFNFIKPVISKKIKNNISQKLHFLKSYLEEKED